MMRGVSTLGGRRAQARRLPTRAPTPPDRAGCVGAIAVQHRSRSTSWTKRRRVYRLPVIRGVVALVESLGIGLRALSISANAQLPEEEQEISGGVWAGTVRRLARVRDRPVLRRPGRPDQPDQGPARLLGRCSGWSRASLRTAIFLGYLLLLSRLRDLRRVFEYHGAEHKVISCYEAEDELTPERAKLYSRLHPRCGTSFLLIVMIMAIFVFAPIGLPAWWILVLTRILGVPLIAGLSFEVIKWAGRNRRRALGAGGHVPGPAAAEADHARARPRPARGLDRGAAGRARGRDARAASAEDCRRRSRRLTIEVRPCG